MKTTLCLLLSIVSIYSFCQSNKEIKHKIDSLPTDQETIEKRYGDHAEDFIIFSEEIHSAQNMKVLGSVLGLVGFVTGVGGIYLYKTGQAAIEYKNATVDDIANGEQKVDAGKYMMPIGGAFLLTGLVLNITSESKIRRYLGHIDRLKIQGYVGGSIGMSLTYKF